MSNELKVTTDYLNDLFEQTNINYYSPEGTQWIRNKISLLVNEYTGSTIEQEAKSIKGNPRIALQGRMFLFIYHPKDKNTLNFYDTFPLVFVLDQDETSILALNIHYLPTVFRARFLDAIFSTWNGHKGINGKLLFSYDTLKKSSKMKAFRPCIKRYLSKNIVSKPVLILPEEWKYAAFLPLERFKKEPKAHVWNQSIKTLSERID